MIDDHWLDDFGLYKLSRDDGLQVPFLTVAGFAYGGFCLRRAEAVVRAFNAMLSRA
jgi:hypothetical protein